MFKIGERIIQLDTPFEYNGVRYPSNWLRLASPEDRLSIGIVEVDDVEFFDRRFYKPLAAIGPSNGTPIPRELTEVKDEQIRNINSTVYNILKQTDWAVIKQIETGKPMSNSIKNERESVRQLGNDLCDKILMAESVDEIKTIVTTINWPIYY